MTRRNRPLLAGLVAGGCLLFFAVFGLIVSYLEMHR